MSVQLNHIIVPAKEKWTSARFLAAILNLEVGSQWGPFVPLRTSNGVTIDFVDAMDFEPHHCAFLVTEEEFEAALARMRERAVTFYADFMRKKVGELNHLYGGRGVYFDDPAGHLFELITQPYGPVPEM
jgi:catechol 2,3-dioxygenase-like lactoylglutathione lyase family enzyme